MRKRAEVSILAVFLSLAIVCLFYPLFEYIRVTENVKAMQKSIEAALENQTVIASVEQYDYIKGNGQSQYVENENSKNIEIVQKILAGMGYTQNGEEWTNADNTKYRILNARLEDINDQLGHIRYKMIYDIKATYTVFGVSIKDITYSRRTLAEMYPVPTNN